MHYFAIGSEQHNKTTMAFKFYPKGVTPKYQVRSVAMRNIPNDELEVPPNTVVRTDGYYRLQRPARIDAFPAAHAYARPWDDARSDRPGDQSYPDPELGRSLRLQLAHQLRLRRRGGTASAGGNRASHDRRPRQHGREPAQSRSQYVGRLSASAASTTCSRYGSTSFTWTMRNLRGWSRSERARAHRNRNNHRC
jgi:hypothetical protein